MSFEQCQSITSLMESFNKTWFVAGGWAIDLFIGKETREHKDLEIALFRKDQLSLKEYLKEWDTNKLNGNKIKVLLNETKDNDWMFRRDLRISYPLNLVWSYSDVGIPYLNPEIVLLYKAKNTREKDHQDFLTINDYLDNGKRQWLRNALELHEPEHNWIQFLI